MSEPHTTKTALVTGAGGGIGEQIARCLARDGVRVICAGRTLSTLQAVADDISTSAHPVTLDVTDAQSASTLLERLPVALREIDVLVNNAGHDAGGKRPLEAGTMAEWESIIATNLVGLVRVTHAILPGMLKRARGHIVNIGSASGTKPISGETLYCASKYGVHGFSETLRLDCADTPVRVTEVMPGMVRTNLARTRFGDAERAEQYYEDFGTCLLPEDVAETVAFAVRQPPHVVLSQLVVLPTGQA